MSDQTHPDADHIDLSSRDDIARWVSEWDITEERLRQLVKDHGTNLVDVANSLGRKL